MAQKIKVLADTPEDLSTIPSTQRREPTPSGCPLTSTHQPCHVQPKYTWVLWHAKCNKIIHMHYFLLITFNAKVWCLFFLHEKAVAFSLQYTTLLMITTVALGWIMRELDFFTCIISIISLLLCNVGDSKLLSFVPPPTHTLHLTLLTLLLDIINNNFSPLSIYFRTASKYCSQGQRRDTNQWRKEANESTAAGAGADNQTDPGGPGESKAE